MKTIKACSQYIFFWHNVSQFLVVLLLVKNVALLIFFFLKYIKSNLSSKNIFLKQIISLTVWLQSFFLLPFAGHKVNFLQTFIWHGLSFSMFTVWHGLSFLVLMFSGLWIEALPPTTLHSKSINTFLNRRTSRFNFRSYVLNLAQINVKFFFV